MPDRARSLALSPNGDRVALGGESVRIVDCRTGKETVPPLVHAQRVMKLSFSQDGYLITAGQTEARVWDCVAGTPVGSPLPHSQPLNQLFLSPDGNVLATICGEETRRTQVQLWDLRTSRPLFSPVLFAGLRLDRLQFHPAGRLLLVSGTDGVCCLLDAATGERVSPVLRSPGARYDHSFKAAFSPDGRQVRALSSSTRAVCSWDLAPLTWDLEKLELMCGILAGQRSGEGGKAEPVSPGQQFLDWQKLRAGLPQGWNPDRSEERAWRSTMASQASGQKRFALALQHLNALIESGPEDLDLRLRRIQVCQELQRWDDALAELAALLGREGGKAQVWSARAAVHAARGHWEKAEADYGEALKRDPSAASAWHERGTVRANLQRWPEPAADFAETLKRMPNREEWWTARVLALRNTGDEKAARAAIREAWAECMGDYSQRKPGWSWKPEKEQLEMLRLALLLPDGVNSSEPVLRIAEELWRESPQQVESNLQYGAALLRAGQPEKALRHLEAVFQAKQGEWTVRAGFLLALAQHRHGKPADAKKTLETAAGLMAEYLKDPPTDGRPRQPWTWKTEVNQLRAEAERVCRSAPP